MHEHDQHLSVSREDEILIKTRSGTQILIGIKHASCDILAPEFAELPEFA